MPALVPPITNERDGLMGFLDQQRHGLRVSAHGLTEEQLRATPTPSTLSVGGLIKHCASVERAWMDNVLERRREGARDEYAAMFLVEPGETVADILALHRAAAGETDAIVADLDLDRPVAVPDAPWFPKDIDAWSVRWVLFHLIQETARHAGHADIIREAIDGATAFPLLAAAENWPATPWLQPWQPPAG